MLYFRLFRMPPIKKKKITASTPAFAKPSTPFGSSSDASGPSTISESSYGNTHNNIVTTPVAMLKKTSTINLVIQAIETVGIPRKGASYIAILKWIIEKKENNIGINRIKSYIKKAISSALENGLLKRPHTSRDVTGMRGFFLLNKQKAVRQNLAADSNGIGRNAVTKKEKRETAVEATKKKPSKAKAGSNDKPELRAKMPVTKIREIKSKAAGAEAAGAAVSIQSAKPVLKEKTRNAGVREQVVEVVAKPAKKEKVRNPDVREQVGEAAAMPAKKGKTRTPESTGDESTRAEAAGAAVSIQSAKPTQKGKTRNAGLREQVVEVAAKPAKKGKARNADVREQVLEAAAKPAKKGKPRNADEREVLETAGKPAKKGKARNADEREVLETAGKPAKKGKSRNSDEREILEADAYPANKDKTRNANERKQVMEAAGQPFKKEKVRKADERNQVFEAVANPAAKKNAPLAAKRTTDKTNVGTSKPKEKLHESVKTRANAKRQTKAKKLWEKELSDTELDTKLKRCESTRTYSSDTELEISRAKGIAGRNIENAPVNKIKPRVIIDSSDDAFS